MNIIEQIAQEAKSNCSDENQSRFRLETVEKKIIHLCNQRRELLGIEAELFKTLGVQLQNLQREKARLEGSLKCPNLPCLDLSVLKWRRPAETVRVNDIPYRLSPPQIVLFDLNSPRFDFVVIEKYPLLFKKHYEQKTIPALPPTLVHYYEDVFFDLETIAKSTRPLGIKVFLSAGCSGHIPDRTRQKIHEVKRKFKRIFIAAEVTDWRIRAQSPPQPMFLKGDPLVLGWDGVNLWIIDQFDLTPIEQYIKDEFSV